MQTPLELKLFIRENMGMQCFIIYLCAACLEPNTDSFHSSYIVGYERLLWHDVHIKSHENPPLVHMLSEAKGQTQVYT